MGGSPTKKRMIWAARTCDEDPDLCVSGLRDLSKAAGLMRRSVNPPCSGCSGVGISSFSNTEEKSSLRTCRAKQNEVDDKGHIKPRDPVILGTLSLTF